MHEAGASRVRRRDLLTLIGTAAGSSVMYQAMTSLGFAAESPYRGPIKLDGDPRGASVLVLGAGLAGLVAAFELRRAGYKVQVLEYSDRPGGRCRTLRRGDVLQEVGGVAQTCAFNEGLYFNPGPWRIPYHHHAVLDYCRRLGVALEPFIQVNHNAYLHTRGAFGGKPQRFREVQADFHGHVAELLSKAVNRSALDEEVSEDDKENLLEALRSWGALDGDYAYRAGDVGSDRRGYLRDPGGGLSGKPEISQPIGLDDLLKSRLWRRLGTGAVYDYQTTLLQPVGGMDMIAKAFAREVGDLIRYDANVAAIRQDENGVVAFHQDAKAGGPPMQTRADWCLCTIPLSILRGIEMNVGAPMKAAIGAIPYAPSFKIGLQFRRRFWEQDEAIYGGITYTDLPIASIGYPNSGFGGAGSAVLLGAYLFGGQAAEFAALSPEERVKRALTFGSQVHPQYFQEFETGISLAWSRFPGSLGCYASWSDASRAERYRTLCEIDGRIGLAGEHASYLSSWQEGAILSALDAIARLHRRVVG